MKDKLDFVGDGDDVNVIHAVEQTFGIKLTDAEPSTRSRRHKGAGIGLLGYVK